MHPAVFAHPLLRPLPVLGAFGTLPSQAPATTRRSIAAGLHTNVSIGARSEYRGVYDLADLDRTLFIVAPGQSGNLLSRHARDFLTRWRDGATITLGPTAEAITATIRLIP